MPSISKVEICPVEDCKLTVDIVLKSSDGELFGAHQRNLEMYNEGFPIAGSAVVSGPVSLEESAEVLHLLLRYTHNVRQPSLDDISFPLLESLAEAVEKYMIYSAMEICKTRMRLEISNHPTEVFLYSAKHNYPALADQAAELTLKYSSSDFLVRIREAGLLNDVAFRWLRYHARWMEVLVQLVLTEPKPVLHKGGLESCSAWPPFQFAVIKHISQDLTWLDLFVGILPRYDDLLADCRNCRVRSTRWGELVRQKVSKLPKYSEVQELIGPSLQ